jgi:hypothetical protein
LNLTPEDTITFTGYYIRFALLKVKWFVDSPTGINTERIFKIIIRISIENDH